MDRSRLLAPGLWMLIVAPVVSAVRALLVVTGIEEPSWYWVGFALGGSLSGLGMLLMGISLFGEPRFRVLVAGAATAFIGHYVLPLTPLELVGPAFVQIGTGIVLWPWRSWALGAGFVAGIGSVVRHSLPFWGNLLLLAGTAALFWAIFGAARADMRDQA